MVPFVALAIGILAAVASIGFLASAVVDFNAFRHRVVAHPDEAYAQAVVGLILLVSSPWALRWAAISWDCRGKACKAFGEAMLIQFGFGIVALGPVLFAAIGINRAIRGVPRALVPFLILQLVMTAGVIVLVFR